MQTAEEYADEALSKMDVSPHEPFTRDEIIKAYNRYKPKETEMKAGKELKQAWEQRCELRAKGVKLMDENRGTWIVVDLKLWEKGQKLIPQGDIAFNNAVIAEFGNIGMVWKNWNDKKRSHECHLSNGLVFKP